MECPITTGNMYAVAEFRSPLFRNLGQCLRVNACRVRVYGGSVGITLVVHSQYEVW